MARIRDKAVTLWLTADERRTLREISEWFGMNQQEFLRHAALGRTVEPKPLKERRKK